MPRQFKMLMRQIVVAEESTRRSITERAAEVELGLSYRLVKFLLEFLQHKS